MANEPSESKRSPAGHAIDEFHTKMQVLRSLAVTQLGYAKENQNRERIALLKKIEPAIEKLEHGELNAYQWAHYVNSVSDSSRALRMLLSFPHEAMLAELLFTSIFSSFDAYLNHLLRHLFLQKPGTLDHAEGKQVQFSDLLNKSRDAIIESVVDNELNSILRDSYAKIFEKLAKKFEVGTLKGYGNWPQFVECSQRRNVITHCDGIAGRQYIEVCKTEGFQLPSEFKAGTKLGVSRDYLLRSIEVVAETGIKLGHVLWRATSDSFIAEADADLGHLIFELLKREEWQLALLIGEFGKELEKRNYRKPREERALKIIRINHAQAAKWSGDNDSAMAILGNFDWSGSASDFQLAVACLRAEWDTAARLMVEVGKNSKYLPIHGYVGWPIFREFRTTTQFLETFRTIFGVEFAAEVKKASEQPKELPPVKPAKKKGRK